ncbi:uncharacterized protein A1O5_03409 [Cladophialophora psammophila CBS 110553]|uniref:Uncharacterized protein n=1 Tax=Cladophialophora psammophila CBS 110553 TaxID=1182543 RepID=W9WZJ9_9EURO|nr:uncharacterized protein A1O5_03409 [Cladophialophora psammophila CBS 110553]EXJ73647.1 hypothetical protein A1O5_03409 [Cladophialophora psammophila CBS 110553]
MGRFTTMILSCLHNLLIQLPQNGYHNISRVVQPQIRSISESFTIATSASRRNAAARKEDGIELQPMAPKTSGEASMKQDVVEGAQVR